MIEYLKLGIKKIGVWSSWLNLALVILICIDVFQRYAFNESHNWIIELEWHLFGLIFLLGISYCLQEDKHVRVDVFYTKFSNNRKAIVNTIGATLLLIPWCIIAIKTCYNYASNSFYIKEGSPNPDGLPAMYIIKYIMVFGFVLLLLQAIISIFENIQKKQA